MPAIETGGSVPPQDDEFFHSLIHTASQHRAVQHPWLTAVAQGSIQTPHCALREFARRYHAYSQWFPFFLRAVIERLETPRHRECLAENLAEARGKLNDESKAALEDAGIPVEAVDGVTHPQLFRRFCTAMGISQAELASPHPHSLQWRQRFLNFLSTAPIAAAVGALGLGTEAIVHNIYAQLLRGIHRLDLSREDYVFFELHCLVDGPHRDNLLEVARELATTDLARAEMVLGMQAALEFRSEFWDTLNEVTNTSESRCFAG